MNLLEAKKYLNDKGYYLTERREFRDPSTYASFYYPDEGPDTSYFDEEAKKEISSNIEDDKKLILNQLKDKYPDAKISYNVNILDVDYISGKDYRDYKAKIGIDLYIEIPTSYFSSIPKSELKEALENAFYDFYENMSENLTYEYEDVGDEMNKWVDDYIIIHLTAKTRYETGDSAAD